MLYRHRFFKAQNAFSQSLDENQAGPIQDKGLVGIEHNILSVSVLCDPYTTRNALDSNAHAIDQLEVLMTVKLDEFAVESVVHGIPRFNERRRLDGRRMWHIICLQGGAAPSPLLSPPTGRYLHP